MLICSKRTKHCCGLTRPGWKWFKKVKQIMYWRYIMTRTPRENFERIFNHEKPEYVPHLGYHAYGIRDYIVERPIMSTGYDAWGCHWIACETSVNITHPDTSDVKFEDGSDWKKCCSMCH